MSNTQFKTTLKEIQNHEYKNINIDLKNCDINDNEFKELMKAIIDDNFLNNHLSFINLKGNKLTSFDLSDVVDKNCAKSNYPNLNILTSLKTINQYFLYRGYCPKKGNGCLY